MSTWRSSPAPRRDPLADHPSTFPWAARLLVICVALWLSATAAADLTSPSVAQPAIAHLLDGLTGTSGLLDAEAVRIRESATKAAPGTLVDVPGFPIEGVGIPREEVLTNTPEAWHAILLTRAAALIYRDGTGPFAADGHARGGPLALRLLGDPIHGWFAILRWFPGIATLGLSVAIVSTLPPVRRWRTIGLAIALGGTLPLAGAILVLGLANFLGGAPGTLSGEAASVVATLARGPIIQSGAVTAGGLALWWWAGRSQSHDAQARLAAAREARDARRRAALGALPEPRRTVR
ncbi:MAG: hypothetical protein EPO65_05765 [Dehalococcoidia bacterium]|nr:MAG: hypothetical protein EPO65_05765 [Dehalococcoidia bacterium]